MSARQEDQNAIVDDAGEQVEDTNVDAAGEDELTSKSDQKQLQNEASDLDQSNIIDDTPGVSTRGKKVDAMKQDREIDAQVGDAEQED